MNTVKCSNRLCEKEYSVEFDKCPFCGTPNPMEESERKTMIEKSKTTDIRNSSSDESLFNGWVTGIIWVNIIFFGARGIISSFTNMIFSPLIGWITLGLSIVGIISLLYILRAKKWAFFLWIAYRIAGAVVVSIINPEFSLTAHIIFAVVNILVMIAVLQIKKNGVSAWSVIFSKHKTSTRSKKAHHIIKRRNDIHNSELYKSEIKANNESKDSFIVYETQCALKENVLSTPISTPTTNDVQEEIPPTIMPNEQPDEKDDRSQSNEMREKSRKERCKKKTLKYNKWWIYIIISVGILAIALLAVWLSHRFSKPALGDYVYVDDYNILHVDRNCENIANIHGAKPITVYSLHEIESSKWKQVCSHCVNDNLYKIITGYVVGSDNLRLLYIMMDEDYELPDYKQFILYMQDSNNREALYEDLIKKGYSLPTYDDFIVDMGFDLKQFATKKIDYGKNYRKKYIRELYDMLKADGAVVGTYAEFSKWCKENGEQGRKNRRRLYDALVADGVNVGSFAEFSSRLGIRTMHDEYDELKRISDETNLDFGIDKYTYQQFCEKYGSKGGLSNLYDALSCIAEEEGIDFNLGNKEEWIASFETDYYGNTKL